MSGRPRIDEQRYRASGSNAVNALKAPRVVTLVDRLNMDQIKKTMNLKSTPIYTAPSIRKVGTQAAVCTAIGVGRHIACPAIAGVVVAGVSSRHFPNQPLLVQVVVVGSLDGVVEVVSAVVEVLSLHPNQPGVSQVLVLVELLDVLVLVDAVAVVLSSRQPHQPGVLHVSVRVRVEVVVGAVVVVVDGLLCVPFSNFQR
jgi:hypothetical protein